MPGEGGEPEGRSAVRTGVSTVWMDPETEGRWLILATGNCQIRPTFVVVHVLCWHVWFSFL